MSERVERLKELMRRNANDCHDFVAHLVARESLTMSGTEIEEWRSWLEAREAKIDEWREYGKEGLKLWKELEWYVEGAVTLQDAVFRMPEDRREKLLAHAKRFEEFVSTCGEFGLDYPSLEEMRRVHREAFPEDFA